MKSSVLACFLLIESAPICAMPIAVTFDIAVTNSHDYATGADTPANFHAQAVVAFDTAHSFQAPIPRGIVLIYDDVPWIQSDVAALLPYGPFPAGPFPLGLGWVWQTFPGDRPGYAFTVLGGSATTTTHYFQLDANYDLPRPNQDALQVLELLEGMHQQFTFVEESRQFGPDGVPIAGLRFNGTATIAAVATPESASSPLTGAALLVLASALGKARLKDTSLIRCNWEWPGERRGKNS